MGRLRPREGRAGAEHPVDCPAWFQISELFINHLPHIARDRYCVCVCVLYAHGYQWSRDRVFVMFSFFSYILQIIKHNGLDFSMC